MISDHAEEDDEVEFTVNGETVSGTVVEVDEGMDEMYKVHFTNENVQPGLYHDGAVHIEEGVAFVSESYLE